VSGEKNEETSEGMFSNTKQLITMVDDIFFTQNTKKLNLSLFRQNAHCNQYIHGKKWGKDW